MQGLRVTVRVSFDSMVICGGSTSLTRGKCFNVKPKLEMSECVIAIDVE